MTTVLGVDACPKGWVGVELKDGEFAEARDLVLKIALRVVELRSSRPYVQSSATARYYGV